MNCQREPHTDTHRDTRSLHTNLSQSQQTQQGILYNPFPNLVPSFLTKRKTLIYFFSRREREAKGGRYREVNENLWLYILLNITHYAYERYFVKSEIDFFFY